MYVTADGAEADLDLGTYERFLDMVTTKANTNTAGHIYQTVINNERRGDYNGGTVQVIPHITDEIKRRFTAFENKVDITIIEIGGTIGDIEGLPFIEATRQFMLEQKKRRRNEHTPYACSLYSRRQRIKNKTYAALGKQTEGSGYRSGYDYMQNGTFSFGFNESKNIFILQRFKGSCC